MCVYSAGDNMKAEINDEKDDGRMNRCIKECKVLLNATYTKE